MGYADIVKSMAPWAYWRFGEPSGTIAFDEMWLHHATYANTPTLGVASSMPSETNTAVTLTAAQQEYIQVTAPTLAGPISVVGWYKAAAAGQYHDLAVMAISRGWILRVNGGTNAIEFLIDLGAGYFGVGGSNMLDGLWHCIAATFDGTTQVVYKDGAVLGSAAHTGTIAQPDGPNLFIGSKSDEWSDTSADEVAIWNRALSATEILSLYQAGSVAAPAGFDAIAVAIAARFAPGVVTAPTGYDPITLSTGDLPEGLVPTPCVLVFPETGTFTHSAGKRHSLHTFIVRFYFNQIGDLERDMVALRRWLTVLAGQLQGAVQLGGIVTEAHVMSWKLGTLRYANVDYSGLELSVLVDVNEAWSPVA